MLDPILEQVTEQTYDHLRVLTEFAARSEPFANEMSSAWNEIYRAEHVPPTAFEETFRTFFSELKQAHLREAYAAFGTWGAEAARAHIEYDTAHHLLRASQRALLPIALRMYAEAPHLPLLLDALSAAFDAVVTVVGAAYIQVAPEHWADRVAPHTAGLLAGGAAHALNNLFAAILGRTQLLLAQTSDTTLRTEIERLHHSALVGAHIVQRLQDYVYGKGGAQTSTDVNALLRDAAELTRFLWRDQAEANGVVIDVVKDFAAVPPAHITASALRQILVALMLNAIEALPNGGRITLRTERRDDQVIISIIDNGIGMTEETRARLGQAPFTTKGAPHLGLGWHLVARILKQFHGTWNVESKPAYGTSVTLALPLAKPATGEITRTMNPTLAANILVIDNEPSIRELLARLLTLHGHNVTTAESGAEGIATFKAGKFDLVLTDLGMPEMSGWDVAREIKLFNPRARVGLLTGWPLDLTPSELRARGVDQVVPKPFDTAILLGLVEDALAANRTP